MAEASKIRICAHCDDSIGACHQSQCRVCDEVAQCEDSTVLTSCLCDFCEAIAKDAITKNCSFNEILYEHILNNACIAISFIKPNFEQLLAEEKELEEKRLFMEMSLSYQQDIVQKTISAKIKSTADIILMREKLAKQRLQYA